VSDRRTLLCGSACFTPTLPCGIKRFVFWLCFISILSLNLSLTTSFTPKLHQTISVSSRYCVVPTVARRTIQDLHLDDGDHQYMIPRKSSILVNIQAVHHNPTVWPNPYQFDPYRFLPPRASSIQPYTFVPFIAGPRNCLGQHLALLESKMVVALLVQRYQFSLPSGHTVQVGGDWEADSSQDPRHQYMVPIVPQRELYVTITRRHPPSSSSSKAE